MPVPKLLFLGKRPPITAGAVDYESKERCDHFEGTIKEAAAKIQRMHSHFGGMDEEKQRKDCGWCRLERQMKKSIGELYARP
jgi:hypothetical protein